MKLVPILADGIVLTQEEMAWMEFYDKVALVAGVILASVAVVAVIICIKRK